VIALENLQSEEELARYLKIRRQAESLLERLMHNRTQTEESLGNRGARDPMRSITGRSAIDQAIDNTQEILRNLDRVLQAEQDRVFDTDCSGLSRLRPRD
jgi:regulator of protease activity HflC (stomatin/prohibitin superfamily)